MSDLAYAIRVLRASPLVSGAAVLSLALGIGASTGLFGIANALLLESLPVREPERLVLVGTANPERPLLFASTPLWQGIRDRGLFEESFAWALERLDLAARGEKDLIEVLWMSEGTFDVLGVRPLVGRSFHEGDDDAGVLLSYDFWKRRFGGAPDVVGRPIVIDRAPLTIAGVLPRGFFGPEVGSGFDVAIPLSAEPMIRQRQSRRENRFWSWLRVMGRLRPEQSLEDAAAALRGAQPAIREATLPAYTRAELREAYLRDPLTVLPAARGASSLRRRYQDPLVGLLAVAALLLLIACGNVANLLLGRAVARRRELGIRTALGGSPWRIVRLVLAESLVLAGFASALGLFLGYAGGRLLVSQLSSPIESVVLDFAVGVPVLAFTASAGLATMMVIGTLPAWRSSRVDVNAALKDLGPGILGSRRGGLGELPVVAQISLSLVLVVAAGLFQRSLGALTDLELGFEPARVLLVSVDGARSAAGPAEYVALYERAREAVRSIPGVASAAASLAVPIGFSAMTTRIETAEATPLSETERTVHKNLITPRWFETLGTRLLAGRDFEPRDRASAPLVAIVNEEFAARFLPRANPLGRLVHEGVDPAKRRSLEIVGVVEDAVYRSVREPAPPTIYLPVAQADLTALPPAFNVVVRSAADPPERMAKSVAAAIASAHRDLSTTTRSMGEQVSATFRQERILAALGAAFGSLALLLVAVGLYGVTAAAVSRGKMEIALRLALGASERGVLLMMMMRAALVVTTGLALGTIAAFFAAGLVQPLLFGVSARDAGVLAGGACLMVTVSGVATWFSARAAARLESASLLR
jgi:predicted permease